MKISHTFVFMGILTLSSSLFALTCPSREILQNQIDNSNEKRPNLFKNSDGVEYIAAGSSGKDISLPIKGITLIDHFISATLHPSGILDCYYISIRKDTNDFHIIDLVAFNQYFTKNGKSWKIQYGTESYACTAGRSVCTFEKK